jgi:hypothetical protein
MISNKSNLFRSTGRVFGLVLCGAMLLTSAGGMDEDNSKSRGLEGTWFTQVTIRDCQTNAVVRLFPALNTFHRGETMTDTTTGVSPSVRSPGLGKWEKTGSHSFSATSLAFLFSSTGVPTGTQQLTHRIEMQGDEISFTSSVAIFDNNGNVVTTGCATAVGRRI